MKAWALAAVASLGCNTDFEQEIRVPPLFSSSDDVERVRSLMAFDTLWAFGGPSDTLLATPRLLRYDGTLGVVFVDARNHAVYRIGPSGNLLWSWGAKGEGPGELSLPRALDVAPDGSVLLVDSGNQRVVRLSSDGQLIEETPLPIPNPSAEAAVALPGGRIAVSGYGLPGIEHEDPFLALWDGDDVAVVELPDGFGEPSAVQHTGQATRWGNEGAWVYGFGYGNGWMTFQGAELMGTFPYVQHFEFPVLRHARRNGLYYTNLTTTPTLTGTSLFVVEDTLHVLFGGEGQLRGRLLDKFDARSGAYLETDVLPHYANEAVGGGDRLFTIENWGMFPRIVALARRSASRRATRPAARPPARRFASAQLSRRPTRAWRSSRS